MRQRQRLQSVLGLLVLIGLLAGCAPANVTDTLNVFDAATATATATSTPTVLPTVTPTASPTLTPTEMPTATPTATPLNPDSIEALRLQDYPGSELVFEETLAPGSNYQRYRVSYLSEGLKIYALLTIPHGDMPEEGWPVIIFNHGHIEPDVYRTTERYIAYTDAFSRNGYILLRSDYRGHDESEGKPTNPNTSPAYAIDVLNGMASVMPLPEADENNVGMWGHSMGGIITHRAMVMTDTIKAGVIWAGTNAPLSVIQDYAHNWRSDAPQTSSSDNESDDSRKRNRDSDNDAQWDAVDPYNYLADMSGPVQIHHGDADAVVPLEWSEIFHADLVDAGIDAELYIYSGSDHNISQGFSTAMARSVAFFDNHLKAGAGD